MSIVKPFSLNKGDKIGITAPSMHITDEQAFSRGIDALEHLGYGVEICPTVLRKYKNTSSPPEQRAQEIMDFFLDPEIKAIICLIGGDTSAQLLRLLDYDVINRNPKIFSGMSDICNLHLAFLSKAHMVSLHGIDLTFGFGGPEDDPSTSYNINLFMDCCTRKEPIGIIPSYSRWECWRPGQSKGRLVGGLLRSVMDLYKTRYWPSFRNIILFWETIGTQLHVIERQLALGEANGLFDNVTGMVIGKLIDCEEKEYAGLLPSLKEIILNATKRYDFPIMANADFGHGGTNMGKEWVRPKSPSKSLSSENPGLLLKHQNAAIDTEGLPYDIAGNVRSQVGNKIADVLGGCCPS